MAFEGVYVYTEDDDLHSFIYFNTLYTNILEVIERPGERPRMRVTIERPRIYIRGRQFVRKRTRLVAIREKEYMRHLNEFERYNRLVKVSTWLCLFNTAMISILIIKSFIN